MPSATATATQPAPSARLEEFERSFRTRELATGLAAVHVPVHHSDELVIGLTVRAGPRYETAETNGVSHFLEHMMFRGSERYPHLLELAEAFESLGGDWNADTGRESTEFWFAGVRHTAARAIELFAEFLGRPRFTDIELERKIILRELDGETNEFGNSTDLNTHVGRRIWAGTSMALPIIGRPESIRRVTTESLRAHRDRLYVPKNMALWVVGGTDSDAMLALVEEHFGRHREALAEVAAPPAPPAVPSGGGFRGPRVDWVRNSDSEHEVQLSFPTGGEWGADEVVYELIERILGDGTCSRLVRRLREELGLVYDVAAESALHTDTGTFDISASVRLEHFDRFFGEMFEILARLATDGPEPAELERAILRATVDIDLAPADLTEVGAELAWSMLNRRDYSLARRRAELGQVSAERVRDVCRELFRPERAALVFLGPEGRRVVRKLERMLQSG